MTPAVQIKLDMLRTQLTWLEREIAVLRQTLAETSSAATPTRTFESLRGIWAGVTFSEADIQASRFELPSDLSSTTHSG
jgi:hypothetical protein